MMHDPQWVSVHGGHSRDFCCHAKDDLESIIRAYIRKGYSWVGITEHMPPVSDAFRYPDETALGLTAEDLYRRFADYMVRCRHYQKEYADQITLFVGFETETYTGSIPFARKIVDTFSPDYMVGSIHHAADLPLDTSPEDYRRAADRLGGMEGLYLRYFDEQLKMIDALRPAVVGHFDLVRIFDPDYPRRLENPDIWSRVRRNLERIRELGLILEMNLAALSKGAKEPYPAEKILCAARDMKIPVVPGDDAHQVGAVGLHMAAGIGHLKGLGFSTQWVLPADAAG